MALYQTFARIWKLLVSRTVALSSATQFGSEVFSDRSRVVFNVVDICMDEFFPLLIAPLRVAIHTNCTSDIFLLLPEPTF